MKFFLVKHDFEWAFAHEAECHTERPWKMPGLDCPARCWNLTTYMEGYCYPAADFSKNPLLRRALRWAGAAWLSDEEMRWREQWKEAEKWQELRQTLLAALPYEVPVTPGTAFGPVVASLWGRPADWYIGEHILVAGSALDKLRAAGINDLFPVACAIKSKRKWEPYFELQIEHSAALSGKLDSRRQTMLRRRGFPLRCNICGRESGLVPKRPVLKGHTIPEGLSLFRLKNRPNAVFCNEVFAEAVTRLKLTNILFVPARTDGSEQRRGFAKAQPSRPELWLGRPEVQPAPKPRQRPRRPAPKQPVPAPAPALELVARARLSARASELAPLVLPSIRFVLNRTDDLPVGRSRFGGLPDLPADVKWPGTAEAPLDFVLQLDLAQIARFLPDSILPPAGFLWFFYDTETFPWGSDPKDKRAWQVLFHAGPRSALGRAGPPDWLPAQALLPACSLEFAKVDSLPSLSTAAIEALKFSAAECERYLTVLHRLCQPGRKEVPVHKLFGHPDAIQNEMPTKCAMASAGLDASFKPDPENPRERRVAAGAKDWSLLLQLDSEEGLGLVWADAGRLFLWLRRPDAAARRFDRCWAIVQCY
ncbi:MAG: double-CXXCG motif protein [Verrucomicrobiota bacterium]|jgi:uncharacterized protein YwqG